MFIDTFVDNRNYWPIRNDYEALLQIENRAYTFEHRRNFGNWLTWKGFNISSTNKFTVAAKIQKINGAESVGYGLVWGLKDANNYYCFNISGNGKYYIGKLFNGQWFGQRNWTTSPISISDYSINALKVVKNGHNMEFYINGRMVDGFYWDYQFFGNNVGFFLGALMKIKIHEVCIDVEGIGSQPKSSGRFQNVESEYEPPDEPNYDSPKLYQLSNGRFTTDSDKWTEDYHSGGKYSDPDYWITHTQDDD